MAYLVTNNTFNPYSFDEMVKPLNMYKQAYDQAMNQYDSLGQLAGEWEKLGKEDPQSQAYRDYQAYSQSLNKAADDLAANGLNPEVRNRIRGLNQAFKQTINPIAEAWQRREVARAAQKDALLKNPDLFFQRDLSNPEQGGIDNFIKDTGYGYGQTVNGAQIRANVQARMAAMAKELRGIGQNGDKSFASVAAGKDVSPELQKVMRYQYRILQENGFRSEDIQKYLNGEPMNGAIKEVLDGVVNSELAASGIMNEDVFSNDQRTRATDIARSGLWAGVGQSDWKYITDTYGQSAAIESLRHNNTIKEINVKAGNGTPTGTLTPSTKTLTAKVSGKDMRAQAEREWMADPKNALKAKMIDALRNPKNYETSGATYNPYYKIDGVWYSATKMWEANQEFKQYMSQYPRYHEYAMPLGEAAQNQLDDSASEAFLRSVLQGGAVLRKLSGSDVNGKLISSTDDKDALRYKDIFDENKQKYKGGSVIQNVLPNGDMTIEVGDTPYVLERSHLNSQAQQALDWYLQALNNPDNFDKNELGAIQAYFQHIFAGKTTAEFTKNSSNLSDTLEKAFGLSGMTN